MNNDLFGYLIRKRVGTHLEMNVFVDKQIHKRMIVFFLPIITLLMAFSGSSSADLSSEPVEVMLIDDFEAYSDGDLPSRWKYLEETGLVQVEPRHMRPKEEFFIVQEGDNKFVRAYTEGEAVHLSMANEEDGFDWNIKTHPYLSWDWRAQKLPEGAREDSPRLNDAGLGFYVIFSFKGIIKRPVSIKYTYSSTLPVGTVLRQGKLRVIVVSNGEDGYGEWVHIERNVLEDYRNVFGNSPPDRPLSIRLWSDSDNTDQVGEGDFDNIMLAREAQ